MNTHIPITQFEKQNISRTIEVLLHCDSNFLSEPGDKNHNPKFVVHVEILYT